MKKLRVNTADSSHKELVAIAVRGKHTKIKTKSGEFVAMIPRHNLLNKHTVKGIVEAMNESGANIGFF